MNYHVYEHFWNDKGHEYQRAIGKITLFSNVLLLAEAVLRTKPNIDEIIIHENYGLTTRITRENIEKLMKGERDEHSTASEK